MYDRNVLLRELLHQYTKVDNRINITTENLAINEDYDLYSTKITLYVPIDTYVNEMIITPWDGHYYTVVDTGTNNYSDIRGHEYEVDEGDRLNNTAGDRYNTDTMNYISYNSVVYYLADDRKLYNSVKYDPINNVVEYYNVNYGGEVVAAPLESIDTTIQSYYVNGNIVKITIAGKEYSYAVKRATYVIYEYTTLSVEYGDIYFVNGSYLYSSVEPIAENKKEKILSTNGSELAYVVKTGFIIIQSTNNITLENHVNVTKVGKAGYSYNVESDYDILSIIGGGYTISYIVSTIEDDGNYGLSDTTVGGSIVFEQTTISTAGGTIALNNNVYSEAYPYLKIKLKPETNYTFIGLFINGEYIENSYNNLSLVVNLSRFASDIVVEAKFAKNVSLEYRMAVNNDESKEYISSLGLLDKLFIKGTISNIYNSINATYQLGDKVYSSSTTLTDIQITTNQYNLIFIVTVPYGTKIEFGVDNSKVNAESAYKFNGWYLLENETVSTSNSIVSLENSFTVYAVESTAGSLKYVAKYSTSPITKVLETTSDIHVYSYDDATGEVVVSRYDFWTFTEDYSIVSAQPTIRIGDKNYIFTGWWQIINNDISTLIANDYFSTDLMGRCVARFVEYRDIVIDFTENSSVAMLGYLHNAYGYIQTSASSTVLKSTFEPDIKFVITTTIFSALVNVSLEATNSFYFKNSGNNEYKTTTITDLNFPLHNETTGYKSSYTISSNVAEVTDAKIRYSKIYTNDEKFIQNTLYGYEYDLDEVIIGVENNTNSFKISIIAENISKGITSAMSSVSSILVMSNNIWQNNLTQNQFIENTVKVIYAGGNPYYVVKDLGGTYQLYSRLVSYRILKTKDNRYYIKLSSGDLVYLDESYDVNTLSRDIVNEKDYTDTVVKIFPDNLTLHAYADIVPLGTIADIDAGINLINLAMPVAATIDTGKVCINYKSENLQNLENQFVLIAENVVERYYPMYTYITLTLAKEYQTESFVGFRVKYDSGLYSDHYATQIGYSFSFEVTESVTISALFKDSVINPSDAPTQGNSRPTIQVPNNNGGYSSGTNDGYGDAAPLTETTSYYTASGNKYLHEFQILVNSVPYTMEFNYITSSFSHPSDISDITWECTYYTDSFNQKYCKDIRFTYPTGTNITIIQSDWVYYTLYTLNISFTQNESSIFDDIKNQSAEMFYPYEALRVKTPALFNDGAYPYINNERLHDFIKNTLKGTGTFTDVEITGSVTFFETVLDTDFIDGFYTYELTGGASSSKSKIDGVLTDEILGTFSDNVRQIESGVSEYNLVYNFKTLGIIRLYVHAGYYDYLTGDYNFSAEQSSVTGLYENVMLGTTISDYLVQVGNENVADVSIELKNDDYATKHDYYFEIKYFFASPLSIYIDPNSLYYAFSSYYYTSSMDGSRKELAASAIPVKTNNSALSISYDEYYGNNLRYAMRNDGTNDYLELYCDVKEDIKSTTLRYAFNDVTSRPKFKIEAEYDSKTYTNSDEITYDDSHIATVKLTNTSDATDFFNVSIKSYIDSYVSDYPNCLKLIYGKNLISEQAKFKVILTNFKNTDQYVGAPKGTGSSDAINNTLDIYDYSENYAYAFAKAYCVNSQNDSNVISTRGSETADEIPTIEWTLDFDFADENEIIVGVRKYYYILFSKNARYTVSGESNGGSKPEINITVYDPKDNSQPITLTTADTTNGYYMSAYVLDGYGVKIEAFGGDGGVGRSMNPNIYYHDMKHKLSAYKTINIGDLDVFEVDTDGNISGPILVENSDIYKVLTNPTIGPQSTLNDETFARGLIYSKISGTPVFTHIKTRTSKANVYTYYPTNSRFYIADYFDIVKGTADKKIVGVIAPGNSSYYKITVPETYYSSYLGGFVFNIAIQDVNTDVTIKHIYSDSGNESYTNKIIYSQYELIEQNHELYLNKGYDSVEDKVNSVEYSIFANSSITYYTYGPALQQVLLAKSMINSNGIYAVYYKQSTLPKESEGIILDYIYKENVEQYILYYDGMVAAGDKYTIDKDGSFKKTTTPDGVTFVKATDADDEVLHGMTLKYLGEEYYILDGKIYTDYIVKSNVMIDDYSHSVLYNPAKNGLFINPNYDNYTIDIYILKFRYSGYTYSLCTDEDSAFYGKMVLRNSGGTIISTLDANGNTTSSPSISYVDNVGWCLGTSLQEATDIEIISQGTISLLDETLPEESWPTNYVKKTIKVNLYDSSYKEMTFDSGLNNLTELEDGSAVNSKLTITYSSDSRKQTPFFTFTDGVNYYVNINNTKIYSEPEFINEVTTFTDPVIKYRQVIVSNIAYEITDDPYDEEYGDVKIGSKEYKFKYSDKKLYSFDKSEEITQFEYKPTKPSITIDGTSYDTFYQDYFANSFSIDENWYYVSNDKVYIDYPHDDTSEVDLTASIVLSSTELTSETLTDPSKIITQTELKKYLLSEYVTFPNAITYSGEKHEFSDIEKYDASTNNVEFAENLIYNITTKKVTYNGTELTSVDYKLSMNYIVLIKRYETISSIQFPDVVRYNSYTWSYIKDSFNPSAKTIDYVYDFFDDEPARIRYDIEENKLFTVDSLLETADEIDIANYQLSDEYSLVLTSLADSTTEYEKYVTAKGCIFETIINTVEGKKDKITYTNASLKSVTAEVYNGYYIKGFIITSDLGSSSFNELWLYYQEYAEEKLTGLQNETYYSNLGFTTFLPIDYSLFASNMQNSPFILNKNEEGIIQSITYTFDTRLYGNMRVYAVYAPVIYTVMVTQVNMQQYMTGDSVDYVELYYGEFAERNEDKVTSGYVKGTLMAEYGGDVWIKAYAYNGSQYLGYSLGKDTGATSIDTVYSSMFHDGQTKVEDIKDMFYVEATDSYVYEDIDTNSDESYYEYSAAHIVKPIPSITTGDEDIYFMDDQKITFDKENLKLNINEDIPSSSSNNIFLFNIVNNLEIFNYYIPVRYTMNIALGESYNGHYDDGGKGYATSYLSYVKDQLPADWQNPASAITANTLVAPEISNMGVISHVAVDAVEFVPTDDPMIYTLYDNYGTLLTSDKYGSLTVVPTAIMNDSINFELSRMFGFLVYNRIKDSFWDKYEVDNEDYNRYFVPSIYATPDDISSSVEVVTHSIEGTSDTATFEIATRDGEKYVKLKAGGYFVPPGQTRNSGNGDRYATASYTSQYYWYKTIPYYETETYLEYYTGYLDEKYNKSVVTLEDGSLSAHFIASSRYTAEEDIATASVKVNNKYIYSVVQPVKNGEIYNVETLYTDNPLDAALPKVYRVFHVNTSDIDYNNGLEYLTYKNKVKIGESETEYTLVVAANTNLGDPSTNLTNYTTEYVDTIIRLYQANKGKPVNKYESAYNKIASCIIFKSEIDENVYANSGYNISSTNMSYNIDNYMSFISSKVVDGSRVSVLNPNLFKITIGGQYVIKSSDFVSGGTTLSIKSKDNPIITKDFYARLNVSYASYYEGQLKANISIDLKIGNDETGSLPTVKIEVDFASPNEEERCVISDYAPNKNLEATGKVVDYTYNASKDTIYKPTGTNPDGSGGETVGTYADKMSGKLDSEGKVIQSDSYFMTNANLSDFFKNIYVSSALSAGEFFELPNMFVRVGLLYAQKVKRIEPYVSFTSDGGSTTANTDINYEMLGVDGTSIYNNHKDPNKDTTTTISNIYLDKCLDNGNKKRSASGYGILKDEVDESKERNNLGNYTEAGLMIEDYYIYIISDAYYVLDLIDQVYMDPTIDNGTAIWASEVASYIATFNPKNYNTNGNYPEYLFGGINSRYTYYELYYTISYYIPDNDLPDPNFYNMETYMKVETIDVLRSSLHAVDANFVPASFTQRDLVISSVELKEMFQNQVGYEDDVFGIDDYYANQAYNFYFDAYNYMDITITKDSFGSASAPAEVMKITDENYATKNNEVKRNYESSSLRMSTMFANAFRIDSSKWDDQEQFMRMIDTSICLSIDDFAGPDEKSDTNIDKVNTIVRVDDKNDGDRTTRMKTRIWELNPKPVGEIVKEVTTAIIIGGTALALGAAYLAANVFTAGTINIVLGVVAGVATAAAGAAAAARAFSELAMQHGRNITSALLGMVDLFIAAIGQNEDGSQFFLGQAYDDIEYKLLETYGASS